jgi:hypothetical protein
MWMACYSQEEIVERENIGRKTVDDILGEFGDFGKLAESAKAAANYAVDPSICRKFVVGVW